jgi:hypothetical protein
MRIENSIEANKVNPREKASCIYMFKNENWTITKCTLKNAFINEA